MKHRPWAGYFLAAIGVGGLMFEVALHVYGWRTGNAYELNHWVLIVLTVIGFAGFYLISPKGAEGGADIITRNAVAIIVAIRSGRRSTDQFATVTIAPVEALGPPAAPKNPEPHPDGSAAPSSAGGDERTELDDG